MFDRSSSGNRSNLLPRAYIKIDILNQVNFAEAALIDVLQDEECLHALVVLDPYCLPCRGFRFIDLFYCDWVAVDGLLGGTYGDIAVLGQEKTSLRT